MGFEDIWNLPLWERIGMSLLCGGMVGFERKLRQKPAGMRTSMLICLGTCLFVYLGMDLTGPAADPGRVFGHVAAGIGFLGAGVILTKGGEVVSGVTTAATVWVLAAVGAAIGLGRLGVALSVSLVTVVVLVAFEALERPVEALARGDERGQGEAPKRGEDRDA